MATPNTSLRKPTFVKVDQLRPGTSGHTLTVKVVSSKLVLQKARPDGTQARSVRIAECIVGDDTGVIVFTARNDQGNPSSAETVRSTVIQQLDYLQIQCSTEISF
ncbi:hypothetical protein O6H91_06G086700 [Diphasiastrum complanatum]|uniref:Uncharacterized protein n=1 Tax=Diphasiastrum complanatum TaxID=34168 RepID=A0ACC2DGD5_DIPCM|nr:hypothetical protein O6H91_06G086700 [Diphasiastrum complanatum]